MDGHYAVIIDLIWKDANSDPIPTITVETIPVADFDPDPELIVEVNKAYSVPDPLLKTDLTIISKKYSPLSSRGARERRTTMVQFHFFLSI